MTNWRFDQGRLEYLQFDEIKNIAIALSKIDGVIKPTALVFDTLRKTLNQHTKLTFAPQSYTVWRNYGRTIKAALLATDVGNNIVVTGLCKAIASNPDGIDSDDYFAYCAKNFYYPSPIFENYNSTEPQVYPVIAIIKFLISRYISEGSDSISIDDIGAYLIANNVSGQEDINLYSKLKEHQNFNGYDPRQVRELVVFYSQFSFLKWQSPRLYLDVKNINELNSIITELQPTLHSRTNNPGYEILQMGSGFKGGIIGALTLNNVESNDEEFTEGTESNIEAVFDMDTKSQERSLQNFLENKDHGLEHEYNVYQKAIQIAERYEKET